MAAATSAAVAGAAGGSRTRRSPLSAVKARLSEIADEVDRTHQRVQITKNGRSYVVLISAEDLASLEATVELLSDPAAMRRVRQAQSDIDEGDFTT
ncbi:MAG: type II toxin-antitoxin system Phd/YefM family antitoxin, partial [Candidatus Limnocylindria bacterium]